MTTSHSRHATLVTRAGTADALDQAVRELTGSDGSGHGTLYALAGCKLAAVMTRGIRFVVCAGSLRLDGRLLREPHYWIARVMGDREPGPPLGRPVGEVVDFSLRHWPAWAAADGSRLDRKLPAFFWGAAADLDPLGIALSADEDTTAAVVRGQPDDLTKVIAGRFPADAP
jgi:hypothetical protein